MSDNEFKSDFPSTETLTRFRNAAIFYFVGGLVLVGCRFLAGKLILTIGAGIIICALGMGWLFANNPVNKRTGALITGVGVLVILSGVRISIFPYITGILLSIVSMGFLVLGIKYLVMYFMAQNKRR